MSKKLKIKLKPGKAKIKLKSDDGTPLLPEAQMLALLAATLDRAVPAPSGVARPALEGGEHDAAPLPLLKDVRVAAPDASEGPDCGGQGPE